MALLSSARLNGQLTYFNKPHVLLIEMFVAGTRTSRDMTDFQKFLSKLLRVAKFSSVLNNSRTLAFYELHHDSSAETISLMTLVIKFENPK